MSAVDWARIGVRLLCAWFVWLGLQLGVLTWVVHRESSQTALISYAMAGVYLIAGIAGWMLSKKIACLIAGTKESTHAGGLDERGAITAATVFAGILLIALNGIKELGDYVTMLSMFIASGQVEQLLSISANVNGLVAVAKLAIGVLLVLKARWLADRIARSGT